MQGESSDTLNQSHKGKEFIILDMHPMTPLIFLGVMTIEPIMQIFIESFEGSDLHTVFVKSQVSIIVSIRALVLAIFLTTVRRRKRMVKNFQKRMLLVKERALTSMENDLEERITREKNNLPFLLITSALLMYLLSTSTLVFFFSRGKTNYMPRDIDWIQNYSLIGILILQLIVTGTQIRFNFKKRFIRLVQIFSLIWTCLIFKIFSDQRANDFQLILSIYFSIALMIEAIQFRNIHAAEKKIK